MRLLFVDDDFLNREIARRMFLHMGLSMDEAASGEEAIEMAAAACSAHSPYDVIMLDITMPGMDGHEAARAIRKAGTGKAILAISGLDDAEVMSDGSFDAFIQKPFTMGSLRLALGPWLPEPDQSATGKRG